MSERSIILRDWEVRAFFEGRKTQVRRVLALPRGYSGAVELDTSGAPGAIFDRTGCIAAIRSPFGSPGDVLWAKETWRSPGDQRVAYLADGRCGAWFDNGERGFVDHGEVVGPGVPQSERICARFGVGTYGDRWRPSIHMPRHFSRFSLRVLDVRAQRLQEISEEDARAEGVEAIDSWLPLREGFRALWDAHGKRHPWSSNPWVWAATVEPALAKLERGT